jgi:hypothetical protein
VFTFSLKRKFFFFDGGGEAEELLGGGEAEELLITMELYLILSITHRR